MSRILLAILLALAWASSGRAAAEDDFQVDLSCGWDGHYRPMEWTPVEIGVTADLSEPFEGTLTVTARQDSLNTLHVVHPFVLTPSQPVAVPLVTKFAFQVAACTLTIRDKQGRTRWETVRDIWDFSDANRLLRPVQENDLFIGVAGQPLFGVLRLDESAVCLSPRGPGEVRIGTKSLQMMPWDWTGFGGLDLLVLYDPDWTALNGQQSKAICDWVSNGGTLLLILGRRPLPAGSSLAGLIPFTIGDLRTCEIPPLVLTDWGLDTSRTESVPAWSLSPKPHAVLWKNIEAPDAGSFFGAGFAGFGRVAVLGFDPSNLSSEQAQRSGQFWTRQVAACLEEQSGNKAASAPSRPDQGRSLAACRRTIAYQEQGTRDTKPPGSGMNRYRISIAHSIGNSVVEHLYRIAQMRPPSLWWLILPLAALAILLGPVDYFLLKRLNRLPLTWLTSAGWILLFTAGAHYGVRYIRGGAMQLRAVSVLDSIADSDCAWATYFAGVYAPRSDEYRLDGLEPGQWWAAMAPSEEQMYANQQRAGRRQLTCVQEEGANLPVSMPVSIWTVQSLLGESPLKRVPFTAEVQRRADGATVKITNTGDKRIAKGYVLWADGYAEFGPVEAQVTQTRQASVRPFEAWTDNPRFVGRPDPSFGPMQGMRLPRYPPVLPSPAESAFLAQGCLSRSLAMHEHLRFGAALVCVVFEEAGSPLGIKDCSYETDHIQFARQLVLRTDR